MEELTHCRRCQTDVKTLDPWGGWGLLWRGWIAGLVPLVAVFPMVAGDYLCSLPSMMLYLVSGGLIRGYAKQRKVCLRCSLEL